MERNVMFIDLRCGSEYLPHVMSMHGEQPVSVNRDSAQPSIIAGERELKDCHSVLEENVLRCSCGL